MKNRKSISNYCLLLTIHIGLGLSLFLFRPLSVIYLLSILLIGVLLIFKTSNNKNQVLYFAGYLVGSEVMLRMTGGAFFYEIGKYSVILFMMFGLFLSGFSRNSFPFWLFLLLLVPGVIIGATSLSFDANIRKVIAFNISGPVCLGISALYCYQREISLQELDNVLLSMFLPILSIVTYMFLYNPSIKEAATGTASNFALSGGFGPNQVSTIVGLGTFLIFTRLLLYSKTKLTVIINLGILFIFAFRGIVTFSRGGMICSAVMIVLLLFILFMVAKRSSKIKIVFIVLGSFFVFLTIWGYSSLQTNGLINKRYANQDAIGRVKIDRLGGREEIMEGEIKMFYKNPIMGIGVGKAKEERKSQGDEDLASHSEMTRMLAEHGTLGVIGLLLLIITPLALYINNRQHIYLLSFYVFWLLTINHAAMRLAAPAFVYALSLLRVNIVPENKNENLIINNSET